MNTYLSDYSGTRFQPLHRSFAIRKWHVPTWWSNCHWKLVRAIQLVKICVLTFMCSPTCIPLVVTCVTGLCVCRIWWGGGELDLACIGSSTTSWEDLPSTPLWVHIKQMSSAIISSPRHSLHSSLLRTWKCFMPYKLPHFTPTFNFPLPQGNCVWSSKGFTWALFPFLTGHYLYVNSVQPLQGRCVCCRWWISVCFVSVDHVLCLSSPYLRCTIFLMKFMPSNEHVVR